MIDDPTSRDITADFDDDTFAGLAKHHLDAITTLLARASERAYRRGFQQGETIGRIGPADIRADIAAWRYGPSTDDSPWADGARVECSTDRLFTENPNLRRLGLHEPMRDANIPVLRHDPTYRPRGSGEAID